MILWPDTFSDHFFPRTARNADWGMLDLARRQLRDILEAAAVGRSTQTGQATAR